MTLPMFPLCLEICLRAFLACSFLTLLANGVAAQTGADKCHVYVVDVAKVAGVLRAAERAEGDRAIAKALSAGQTIFPEFLPTIGEEELTTMHYPFPGNKLVITGSVFYTDESMTSHGEKGFAAPRDSMLIGIAVSTHGKPNAIDAHEGNSLAEVTYDQHTNKVRAKQYVKVRGRIYIVGIECDCMSEERPR
jgi:hypothetical protein